MTEITDMREMKRPVCPTCHKPIDAKSQDRKGIFCSKRCANVDLGRWLNGSYAIPGSSEDAESFRDQDDAEN
jgi:uncharacterized protein